MSRKLISLCLVICMLFCLSACSTTETFNSSNSNYETQAEKLKQQMMIDFLSENSALQTESSSTSTESKPVVERRLSADYKVISCGQDGFDYYEVVYKEEEDYTGVTRYAGLIKNNEWDEELSETSPFLYRKIIYVGKGCFLLTGNTRALYYDPYMCIYNVKNKQKYLAENNPDYSFEAINFVNIDALDEELLIVGVYINKEEQLNKIKLLNKSTMQTHDIELKPTSFNIYEMYWRGDTIMNNICDGVFSIAEDVSGDYYGRSTDTFLYMFYDIEGNEILNLREYMATRNNCYFRNGRLIFGIRNSNNTKYTLIIDKAGNVIEYN